MLRKISSLVRRNEKGQATIELAISIMAMLLVLFGIIEFGRALVYYNDIGAAARESCRAGIVSKTPTSSATSAANTYISNNMKSLSPAPNVSVSTPNGVGPGLALKVTITYNMPIIFPLVFTNSSSITITRSIVMLQEDV